MTPQSQDSDPIVSTEKIYTEVRSGIRETDSISFKLLGLVPLVSGTAIVGFILQAPKVAPGLVVLLALFAAAITLGLFRWELRNVQTCRRLLKYAELLEEKALAHHGIGHSYAKQPAPPQGLGKTQAEKLIYAATICAWVALPACLDALPQSPYREMYGALAGVILSATVVSLFAATDLPAAGAKGARR